MFPSFQIQKLLRPTGSTCTGTGVLSLIGPPGPFRSRLPGPTTGIEHRVIINLIVIMLTCGTHLLLSLVLPLAHHATDYWTALRLIAILFPFPDPLVGGGNLGRIEIEIDSITNYYYCVLVLLRLLGACELYVRNLPPTRRFTSQSTDYSPCLALCLYAKQCPSSVSLPPHGDGWFAGGIK